MRGIFQDDNNISEASFHKILLIFLCLELITWQPDLFIKEILFLESNLLFCNSDTSVANFDQTYVSWDAEFQTEILPDKWKEICSIAHVVSSSDS